MRYLSEKFFKTEYHGAIFLVLIFKSCLQFNMMNDSDKIIHKFTLYLYTLSLGFKIRWN